MSVLKEYFRNMLIILISVIIVGISSSVLNSICNETLTCSIIMILIDIFVITLLNIFIVKRIIFNEDKIEIKEILKMYPKALVINAILTIITYFIASILMGIMINIDNMIVLGITAIIMYLIKMFLSFSLFIYVDREEKILKSIITSLKLVSKNVGKVLLYNILFLILTYIINFITKNIYSAFWSAVWVELMIYLIFVMNVRLYFKIAKN